MAMAELERFQSFLALFLAVLLCLAFTYHFVLRLPPGLPRLSFLIPLLPVFFLLPWFISVHHLRAVVSFVFLWTLPSKLLLLCCNSPFDFYPLSPSASGFLYFLTSVLLPIRITGPMPKQPAGSSDRASGSRNLLLKIIVLVSILNLYPHRDRFPTWVIHVLYQIHVYLGVEVFLGALAKLAVVALGVVVDPQSNSPFMSASLSEFWSRRWNLVVTSLLRSTVYVPTLLLLTRAKNETRILAGIPDFKDSSYSRDGDDMNNETQIVTDDMDIRPSFRFRAIALLVTFLVSGLLHELIFYFISKSPAAGHATAFFLLHGLATALEAFVRRTCPSLVRLPRAISHLLTLAFLHFSSVWLFFPPLTRTGADIKIMAEYHQFQSAFVALFKTLA